MVLNEYEKTGTATEENDGSFEHREITVTTTKQRSATRKFIRHVRSASHYSRILMVQRVKDR